MEGLNPELLKSATDVKCEACESKNFKKIVRIKKLSKLLTGAPEDAFVPIPLFACAECGHVNKDFEIETPVIT